MKDDFVPTIELPPPTDRASFEMRLAEERQERRVRMWGRRITDVGNWCYASAVKVVQFPAYAMDLLDRYGKPDHSKMGPFLVSQELIAIQAYDVIVNRNPLQASIVLIAAVLSFASASLMRLLIQQTELKLAALNRTSSTHERREISIDERRSIEVIQRRDPVLGFDPSEPKPDPDHQEVG